MIGKILYFLKTLPARIFHTIHGPLREIRMEEVVDRLGNKMTYHELLRLLGDENEEILADYYHEYNKTMCSLQKGEWLNLFLGYSKDISYWITPWGGAWKPYYVERHLTFEYSKEYLGKLKKVRDLLVQEGYHPEQYGYITGELLIDEQGRKRFIVWNGHRRILSLSHLQYQKIPVEISGGDRWTGEIRSHIVRLANLKDWKNVKNGLYTAVEAEAFFRYYFKD